MTSPTLVDPKLFSINIDSISLATPQTNFQTEGNPKSHPGQKNNSKKKETKAKSKKLAKPEDIDDNEQEGKKEAKPKGQKPPNCCVQEDQSLCTSWLNMSKDTIVGVNQTKSAFWDCIHTMYLDLMDEVAEANKKKKEFKPFPTRIKGAVEN
jgi:hypothetical protein